MTQTTMHNGLLRDAMLTKNVRPLANDEIMRFAPSVLAEDKHPSRSDRYAFISTITVVEAMRQNGFFPIRVAQGRTRIEDRRDFTRHVVVFRQADDIQRGAAALARGGHHRVDELFNEIVLYNSHDGSSSYQLSAGKFRLVCTNGLIVSEAVLDTIRVPHAGRSVADRVVEGAFYIMQQLPVVDETIAAWQQAQLPAPVQAAFGRAAIELRWDDADGHRPVGPADVLRPHRPADQQHDLWTVFNRVQENLLKGGMLGRTRKGDTRKVGAVNGVSDNVRLNKALWTLATELGKALGVETPEPLELPARANVIEGELVAA